MDKQAIKHLFYVDNNYQEVISLCAKEINEPFACQMSAKSMFALGNLDGAYLFYRKINMNYEAGYCQLLKGFTYLAEKIWLNSNPDAFDISWGLSLISMINDTKIKYPNFFQIRSFLEQDINNFIKFSHKDFVDKLIKQSRIFAQINPESFKFFGRVLLHNNENELAKEFLDLSKDFCYKDPETHFLLGTYYLKRHDILKAKKSFKISTDVANGYFPAEKMLLSLR